MKKDNVYVTQPFLPPLEEFIPYLEEIWERKILTNNGPYHQELESALCEYLGVEHISLMANGTIALVVALRALGVSGEVITTPYSFVATAHALSWNGLEPVFVDVDARTLNLDPSKIEAAITPRTSAIMPVHCYGHPCEVEAIQAVAEKHRLKVIYDAAHAFGVRSDKGSILRCGDLSVLSFHATKVFSTFEGGAIVCPDAETKLRIDQLKNFGFVDETTVVAVGINGKLNEIGAAFGLLQLKHFDDAISRRRNIDLYYREKLEGVRGLRCLEGLRKDTTNNYAYFPILISDDYRVSRDALYDELKADGIFARRYFYPLISEFPMYKNVPSAHPANLPAAKLAADQVLCLPIYPALALQEQDRVLDILRGG